MQHLQLENEDEYVARLRGAAPHLVEAELRNLLNLVTVNETYFFRDASQFRLLRDHIIPTLVAERMQRGDANRVLRIWSAGCSSGEEAYSIALTLEDMGARKACPGWTFEIIGTDLNTRVLEKARRGVYSPRAVRNVEGRLIERYFVRHGRQFALSDAIKQRVKFEFGNLTQTPMPSTGPQDIVFCKNVAIYFRPNVSLRLISGLYNTLAADGYLLLGHAESLWQLSESFVLVEHERAFCYRKRVHAPASPVVSGVLPSGRLRRRSLESAAVRQAVRRRLTEAVPRSSSPGDREDTSAADDAATRYDACLAMFRAGDWDAAESALASLAASCPTFVPALVLLGGLYAHRARFDDARRQAEAVLKVSDLEPRAHLLLGMIAARQQRSDEALQSLRRALYLDDSLALAHFWLGNLYRDRGEVARACREYENVVRDWERQALELTEEFASDLTPGQLAGVCRDSLERLQTAHGKR